MELRMGDPVEGGGGGELGLVRAFSITRSGWVLRAVLVEPEHRVGLGKWVSLADFESTAADSDLLVKLDGSQFDALPAGESTAIVEGVRTSIYHVPTLPWLRLVSKEIAAAGCVILNEASPIRRDGDEIGHIAGLVGDDDGQIESVLMVKKKLIGKSEVELRLSGLTLEDWGIRAE